MCILYIFVLLTILKSKKFLGQILLKNFCYDWKCFCIAAGFILMKTVILICRELSSNNIQNLSADVFSSLKSLQNL